MIRDLMGPITKWFESEECCELPLTDVTARYFWLTEPTQDHNFDTLKVVNHNEGDIEPSEIDPLDECLSEPDEDIIYTRPVSRRTLVLNTGWYNFEETRDQNRQCYICHMNFQNAERILELQCGHQFHYEEVNSWLTMSNGTCPISCSINILGNILDLAFQPFMIIHISLEPTFLKIILHPGLKTYFFNTSIKSNTFTRSSKLTLLKISCPRIKFNVFL